MFKIKAIPFVVLAVVAAFGTQTAVADDVSDTNQLLCSAVQATVCLETGECVSDLPWNVNVPDFIEVDLEAGQLSTTAASGQNRATPIEHLNRQDGMIVFHGFEMGRAFSWVIDEPSGRATVALAADGASVSVFGVCTPIPTSAPNP